MTRTALLTYVAFFRALDETQQSRFRNLVKIFVDEVPITGIRTDADETTRALVAASAVIPVFGFDDWEYSGLGEVLIYPTRRIAFDIQGSTSYQRLRLHRRGGVLCGTERVLFRGARCA